MRIFRNLKITSKLIIGFVIISTLLLFIGFRDYSILSNYQASKGNIYDDIRAIDAIKEVKYLMRKDMHSALKILHSNDLQSLDLNWQIHKHTCETFTKLIDSVKYYTEQIEDGTYIKTKKRIIYDLSDAEEKYKNNILSTIKTIKNTRQDIIEKPSLNDQPPSEMEEGGIIFTDETELNNDQLPDGILENDTIETQSEPIDEKNQDETTKETTDQNSEEAEDDMINIFGAIDDNLNAMDQEGEGTLSELEVGDNQDDIEVDNSEIMFGPQNDFGVVSGMEDDDMRTKRITDAYNYIDATGKEIIKKLEFAEKNMTQIVRKIQNSSEKQVERNVAMSAFIVFGGLILSFIIAFFIARSIANPINRLQSFVYSLAEGKLPETLPVKTNDEIGEMTKGLNLLVDGLRKTSEFSLEIGRGNFLSEFTPLSKDDVLGNSLLDMRESLKEAKDEEQKRKIEDQRRNWATEGLAQFGEILRQHTGDLDVLSDNIIQKLVKYMNANQGGLFVFNDTDTENKYLELTASYAYNRKKYIEKKIYLGEGLVGMCALERYTIYMTDVPDEYIEIESGLGYANPNCILIVPLKTEDNILGVIEIASFNEFQKHEIELVERIAESIASTLSSIKINARTAELLKQSRSTAVEMQQQDEKMRQSIEMLQATQEEAVRQEKKLRTELESVKNENDVIKAQNLEKEQEINQLKNLLKQKTIDV